jgi:hypothetical protein
MRFDVAAFALSALVLVAPAVGHASPTFPPAIKSLWGVSRFPSAAGREGCLLCHATDVGGVVGTPFGRTAKARGASGNNDFASLSRALDGIRSSGVDSDGDEIGDYLEIARDRTDPNDPDDFVVPEPSGGGAGGEPGSAGGAASGGVGVVEPPVELPDFGEFPPLPQHGCEVSPGGDGGLHATASFAIVLALMTAAVRPRGRRRRRIDTKAQRDRAQNVSCNDLRAPVHTRRRSAHGQR